MLAFSAQITQQAQLILEFVEVLEGSGQCLASFIVIGRVCCLCGHIYAALLVIKYIVNERIEDHGIHLNLELLADFGDPTPEVVFLKAMMVEAGEVGES